MMVAIDRMARTERPTSTVVSEPQQIHRDTRVLNLKFRSAQLISNSATPRTYGELYREYTKQCGSDPIACYYAALHEFYGIGVEPDRPAATARFRVLCNDRVTPACLMVAASSQLLEAPVLPPAGDKHAAIAGVTPSMKRQIVAHLRTHRSPVGKCYRQRLAGGDSKLAGRVVVQFSIEPGGAVASAKIKSNTTGSASFGKCVIAVVTSMRFPRLSQAAVKVSYPFVFQLQR